MRYVGPAFTLVVILFAAEHSIAATYSVTSISTSGASISALKVGDTVTIGYRVSAGAQQIYGIDSVASGYNESVIDFQNGSCVPAIFYKVAVPPSTVSSGLDNLRTAPIEFTAGGIPRVIAFSGADVMPYSAQPLDPGLNGVVGGGDAQFRLTFVATGVGSSAITFGSAPSLGHITVGPGGSTLPDANAIITVTVLPTQQVPAVPRWMMAILALLLAITLAWSWCNRAGTTSA